MSVSSHDTVLDCTVGIGGHAQGLCAKLGAEGNLIGIDQDQQAVDTARQTLAESDCAATVSLRVDNFRNADKVVRDCGFESVDAALFDLGFRSEQLSSGRGFSFQEEAPLFMTYQDPATLSDEDVTARTIVNQWSQASISSILEGFANESYAESIAAAIVEARKDNPIKNTTQLVRVIRSAVPSRYRNARRHPATKTFQALRMAVNDEVQTLKDGLRSAFSVLSTGGRLAVISFHSVEDRIVKKQFAQWADEDRVIMLTDKPVTPKESEIEFNPRARSAKMRCIQKESA